MSLRKDPMAWGFIGLALILVGIAAYFVLLPQLQPHVTMHVGDGVYTAQVAKTATQRSALIAETPSLRDSQALLLIYGSEEKWMVNVKDLKFSADMVGPGKDKKVVYVVKNAAADSYSDEQFVSKQNAQYVILLPAGTVTKKSINIDSEAAFDETHIEGWGQG